jgi:carbonic anhydrase/acetyltransferase-like protein (isoleucine patch superfamily)
MLIASPKTSWVNREYYPEVAASAYVSPTAVLTGFIELGEGVLISPGASIRGDEGGKIFIGNRANVQDNVIMHGLKEQSVLVDDDRYSIYISEEVSCAHASIIHGPAFIGRNTFIGFGTVIHSCNIGRNCFIGHGATVIGVTIADGKYIPHGIIVESQQDADALSEVPDSARDFNHDVVAVNAELAIGYSTQEMQRRRGA